MERQREPQHLTAEQVDVTLHPDQFGFTSTEELEPLTEIVGQPRALRALDLGLGIRHASYNIYVAGLSGTGKKETIRRELARRASAEPKPRDWIYVNHFEQPDRPLSIALPAGEGARLKHDLEDLLERLLEDLPKAFREEDFNREKRRVSEQYHERRRSVFEELETLAREKGLAVEQMPNGQVALVPMKDDRPMTPDEIKELSDEQRKSLQERQREVAHQGEEILRRQEDITHELRSEVRGVERGVAAARIEPELDRIAARYEDEKLQAWFEQLKRHMIEHLDRFREPEGGQQQMAVMLGIAPPPPEERLREYRINLLVDNSRQEGAPVVIEESPNYKNLFGTIEKVVDRFGKLVTDFTQIKAGSLLKASGGYLVINLLDALTEPMVWKELKRTLKSGQLKVETYDPFAIFTTSGMNPEPIPLDVKLVVLGNPLLYHLLHLYDEDFAEIFKVKAEFIGEMDRQEESGRVLGRLARKLSQQEDLPPIATDGIAELVRAGCRMADDKEKLTAEFSRLADLAREAGYWARQDDDSAMITRKHVRHALDEKVYRSDWIAAKIRELIRQGTLRIRIDGKAVGQINGLAVANLGDYAFGRPSRVTASVGVGAAGVINIERESKLSGRTYDKGVLILDGYLRNQYAGEHPLALSASIAMEQSYGMIDGDSASVTELLCLLSALAKVPMRQDIAVTGSINQWGEVQAIGGVNEKVEGFFDVCRDQGLTGEQGVAVPASNVRHLLLRPDVVEAIREGTFHVWAIEHVDEGLQLLSGIPAGRLDEAETFHGRVDHRLRELAAAIKEQRAASLEREFPLWEPIGNGPRDPRPTLPGRD